MCSCAPLRSRSLSLPNGLPQRVHRDGRQPNLAVGIALDDNTPPTRFVDASQLYDSYRGGRALESLAHGKTCADLPAGEALRAGEAIIFDTSWWHAGPSSSELRRFVFVPLTGGTKDRRGQTENNPILPKAVFCEPS